MPALLVSSIAEKTGIPIAEAEHRWAKAKTIAADEKRLNPSDGDAFWRYVTGVFKKSMGIGEDGAAVMESAGGDWRDAIRNAKSFKDISAVFEPEFPDAFVEPDIGGYHTRVVDGVRIIDVPAKSKIEKGVKTASLLTPLDVKNLFDPDMVDVDEAKKIAKSYYDALADIPINSPAFSGEQILFDAQGWQHLNSEGHERKISDLDVKRRLKLLPKAKTALMSTQFVDEIRKGENGNPDEYSILGRFSDGDIIRVVVHEIEKEGKKFLSVFDMKDIGKKLKKAALSGHSSDLPGRRVDKAPSSKPDKNILPEASAVNNILESIDSEAHKAATSPKNDLPGPTPAQADAGNYKKGHVSIQGLDIAIENPKGSKRRGISKSGKAWENLLHHHYGYIKGTVGRDNDHIDVFIGDRTESPHVYVVNQVDPESGSFDEHKVMLGFDSRPDAENAYLSNYEKGWKGIDSMATLSMGDFKDWLVNGNTKMVLESIVQENQKPTIAQDQSRKAMKFTLDTKTNTMEGASRPDAGWIAFFWGNAGTAPLFADGDGLARIIAKQDFEKKYLTGAPSGRDLCMRLVDIVTRGYVKRKYGPTSHPKIDFSWQGEVATVSWDLARKTWYLSAWREDWGGILESASGTARTMVGRTWQSKYGQRTIVSEQDGKLWATTGAKNVYDGYLPGEIEQVIATDESWAKYHAEAEAKEAADAEKEAAEKLIRENTGGFTDGMTSMQKGRALTALNKQLRFDGIVMTRKKMIEKGVSEGMIVVRHPSWGRLFKQENDDSFFEEKTISKIGMDYAEFLISKRIQDRDMSPHASADEASATRGASSSEKQPWADSIRAATSFQDIADVFKNEFGVTLDDGSVMESAQILEGWEDDLVNNTNAGLMDDDD